MNIVVNNTINDSIHDALKNACNTIGLSQLSILKGDSKQNFCFLNSLLPMSQEQ